MTDSKNLAEALRDARLAQAVQLDAVLSLHDARVLRLDALQAAVLPRIAGHAEANSLFELNVQQGLVPRLWIDLISSVVMEPDAQTYQLVQDSNGTREILHETRDLKEMADFVTKYLAHRIITHEKLQAGVKTPAISGKSGYSAWELTYVWFTGLTFGVLCFLIAAILLGKLHF